MQLKMILYIYIYGYLVLIIVGPLDIILKLINVLFFFYIYSNVYCTTLTQFLHSYNYFFFLMINY
jgi:hypothetical protein